MKVSTTMKEKDTIIVHCSATQSGAAFSAADIDRWHRERGFSCIGYHYVVGLDGKVETGRPYTATGAHALGWNRRAVGICYIGGLDCRGQPTDTRTPDQRRALVKLIKKLLHEHPALQRIMGHRDVSRKACPSFDAQAEYAPLLMQAVHERMKKANDTPNTNQQP